MILNKSMIIFGKGDVVMTSAVGEETGTGKIFFDELEKPVKIGTKLKNFKVEDAPHPIEFIFEEIKSIDVLIETLESCKKGMIKHQKAKKGEKNEHNRS